MDLHHRLSQALRAFCQHFMTAQMLELLARILELLNERNALRAENERLRGLNYQICRDLNHEIRKSNDDAARLKLQSNS